MVKYSVRSGVEKDEKAGDKKLNERRVRERKKERK